MSNLVHLLKDASERFGPSTALTISMGIRQQRWTYQMLWDLSGSVAALLKGYGLVKGDRAIIWAPNRPEWVVAFFGCLRAGVVVVPLDVLSAPDFVARIIEQTEPKLAFLSRQTADGLQGSALPQVRLEDLEELVEGVTPAGDDVQVDGEDIAEIMFTSGTTGDPKGVVLTHRNIASNVSAAAQVIPIKPSYRLLSLVPLSHMLEQTGGLLVPLSYGASVVYPVSRQPRVIFNTIRANQVTVLVLVPQVLQGFMNAIERQVKAKGKEGQWRLLLRFASVLPTRARRWLFRPVHRQLGGRLSFVMSGGSYLDPVLSQKWGALGVPVFQAYGTTETSPVITTNTFGQNREGSVGRVLPGQDVRIAADGEVLTRGPNVTQGYWQNPDATGASFDDEGWYKTGDLGYLDDEGYLYLKGRKKDLIVLADGRNVYPEDVEVVLCNRSGVRDAVVIGVPKNGGAPQVHAVLLLEDGFEADAVVRSTNSLLPEFQRISDFTVWEDEDFPRTHTLKVKKPLVLESVLSRERQEPDAVEDSTVPASDLHRILASVCSLALEELTPEKSLGPDLGLDSLGRVELLSAIEAELGVYIDEERVSPETTLQELEVLAEAEATAHDLPFPGWGRRLWCRALRRLIQRTVMFPLLHLFYRVSVQGREHLNGLDEATLFVSNHNVKMDNPLILMALPSRWRRRLCPAAAADDIFGNRVWRYAAPLLANAFPFAREGAVRPSLENLGQLLDWGWSVLIYPEGYNTHGEMTSFKAGAGLIAVESRTPVVPIRVRLHKGSVFDGAGLFSRGEVEVRFGKPITFARRTDYREATTQLETAVRAL